MSDTPETDAQTWAGHCGDGDWGKVVYAHWAQKLERERDEAAELLASVMRDEVNHQDEAEKWLRAYAPQYLFQENAIGHAPGEKGNANE